MKLYVWCDPYLVKYGCSMVFAVAESEAEAREQIKKGKSYAYGEYEQEWAENPTVELGAPTRVVDLPCAEWHEWSE